MSFAAQTFGARFGEFRAVACPKEDDDDSSIFGYQSGEKRRGESSVLVFNL